MGIFDFFRGGSKDKKKDGPYKSYYENGKLRIESNYSERKLHGPFKNYYQNGKLRVESNYSEGKLHGPFKNYYQNGRLWGEGNFNKGELHGILKFQNRNFDNELLNFEMNYVNGKTHGTCREFYKHGKLKTECYYNNEEIEDLENWKQYQKDGKLKSPQDETYDKDFGLFSLFSIPSKILNEVDMDFTPRNPRLKRQW